MSRSYFGCLIVLLFFILSCSNKRIAGGDEVVNIGSPDSTRSVFFNRNMVLGIDLNQLGKGASVMFFDKTCVIASLKGRANSIMASSEFDPQKLPMKLQDQFYQITDIILTPPFIQEEDQENLYPPLPQWLKEMKDVEYLCINNFEVNNLNFLIATPVKHLILQDVKVGKLIIENFAEIKTLKYLAHKSLFSETELSIISEKCPNLIVLLEDEYFEKVDAGEINLR